MDHAAEEFSFSGARSAQPAVEWSTTRFEAIRPTQHPSSAVRDPSNVKFHVLSPWHSLRMFSNFKHKGYSVVIILLLITTLNHLVIHRCNSFLEETFLLLSFHPKYWKACLPK
jgi:hypothetical protein